MKTSSRAFPYKSSAETFLARTRSSSDSTLPEFKVQPDVSKQPTNDLMRNKTNLLAFALLQLWTPKKQNETENFIPCYELEDYTDILKLREHHLTDSVYAFHQFSWVKINNYFSHGLAQNLGALTLLNLLMSSKCSSSSLGIAISPVTSDYLFTQKFCSFWLDYFNSDSQFDLFSQRSFDQQLNGFIQLEHKTWWNNVLRNKNGSSMSVKPIFLNEIFETALRIYLTPTYFLEEIASKILDKDHTKNNFKLYFFNKIERFKQNFDSLLSPEEQQNWHDYIHKNGSLCLHSYLRALPQFRIEGDITFQYACPKISSLMYIHAMRLKIPNLMPYLSSFAFEKYLLGDVVVCFIYCIEEIKREWEIIGMLPEHDAWRLLEKLVMILEDNRDNYEITMNFSKDTESFLHYFVMKCILLQKNNIAGFLLQEFKTLINLPILPSLYLMEEEHVWLNHSPAQIAQQVGNYSITDFLAEQNINAKDRPMSPSFFRQRERSVSDDSLKSGGLDLNSSLDPCDSHHLGRNLFN